MSGADGGGLQHRNIEDYVFEGIEEGDWTAVRDLCLEFGDSLRAIKTTIDELEADGRVIVNRDDENWIVRRCDV